MEQMQRMMQQRAGGGQGGPPGDTPQVDTAEQVYISSLALLKMLKHGERLQPAQVLLSWRHSGTALHEALCRTQCSV